MMRSSFGVFSRITDISCPYSSHGQVQWWQCHPLHCIHSHFINLKNVARTIKPLKLNIPTCLIVC